jgi:hypothetical protein
VFILIGFVLWLVNRRAESVEPADEGAAGRGSAAD